MRADMNIVRNLHKIIELHTIFNDGVIQCTAINTGISANLNIITDSHTAKLLNFEPLPCVIRKTETISANHDTRMQQTAFADTAILTDCDMRTQDGSCTNPSSGFHNAVRANVSCCIHHRSLMHHS